MINDNEIISLMQEWVDAGSYDIREADFSAKQLLEMESIEKQIAALGYDYKRKPYNCIGGDVFELSVFLHGQLIGLAKTTNLPD